MNPLKGQPKLLCGLKHVNPYGRHFLFWVPLGIPVAGISERILNGSDKLTSSATCLPLQKLQSLGVLESNLQFISLIQLLFHQPPSCCCCHSHLPLLLPPGQHCGGGERGGQGERGEEVKNVLETLQLLLLPQDWQPGGGVLDPGDIATSAFSLFAGFPSSCCHPCSRHTWLHIQVLGKKFHLFLKL